MPSSSLSCARLIRFLHRFRCIPISRFRSPHAENDIVGLFTFPVLEIHSLLGLPSGISLFSLPFFSLSDGLDVPFSTLSSLFSRRVKFFLPPFPSRFELTQRPLIPSDFGPGLTLNRHLHSNVVFLPLSIPSWSPCRKEGFSL